MVAAVPVKGDSAYHGVGFRVDDVPGPLKAALLIMIPDAYADFP